MIQKQKMQIKPVSLRVLEVPKLLSLICSFAPISDCARLSRSCKAALKGSAASVWNHADGRNILNLLGETRTVSAQNVYAKNKTVIRIASPIDFSRFDFYAPYVHKLNVYGPGPKYPRYNIENWSHLLIRARQRPLLPSLTSIIIHSPTSTHGPDELVWIRTFISPSLVEIRVVPDNIKSPTYLAPLTADSILNTVVERCPKLLKLSLCPAQIPISTKAVGPPPTYKSLRNLSSLTKLTCSMPLIENNLLPVIGSFPALQQLTVLGLNSPAALDPRRLSTNSFPALRKLHLAGLDRDSLISILNVSPLMNNITHLNLKHILTDNCRDDHGQIGEWIACALLPRLENSPYLQSLTFKLDSLEGIDIPHDIGYDDLVETFSKLPLQSVTLAGVKLGELVYDLEALKNAFPHVMDLHIMDQPGSPLILGCFAELPKLQHLEVRLDLEGIDRCPERPSRCRLHTLESSIGGAIGYRHEDLEITGAALLMIYPNLRKVVWPPSKQNDSPKVLAQRRFVDHLNRHINLKREMNELQTKLGLLGRN